MQAAAQRAQPTPHNTSTAAAQAIRYRSQPDKTQGLSAHAHEVGSVGDTGAGKEKAGAAGGW